MENLIPRSRSKEIRSRDAIMIKLKASFRRGFQRVSRSHKRDDCRGRVLTRPRFNLYLALSISCSLYSLCLTCDELSTLENISLSWKTRPPRYHRDSSGIDTGNRWKLILKFDRSNWPASTFHSRLASHIFYYIYLLITIFYNLINFWFHLILSRFHYSC